MDIIHKKFRSDSLEGKWVITIGNFDGYHKGHQALVQEVLKSAEASGAKGGLLTFDPHPKKLLQPEIPFRHIYDDESKLRFLKESGLDACFMIPFTREFASLPPLVFLEKLFQFIALKKIIVGYDFNFGKAREGSASLLKEKAREEGVEFVRLDPVKNEGNTVSSTMIRRLLFEAEFDRVQESLGRPWSINGTVLEGDRIGRTINFPTLNLEPEVILPIRNGVYSCQVELEGELYEGICNIGYRPTFRGETFRVEAHLFDFSDEVYGKFIRVVLKRFIREEMKFASPDHLKDQIRQDIKEAMTNR